MFALVNTVQKCVYALCVSKCGPTKFSVCVFITAVPITKLFAWGGGGNGGHVLRETVCVCFITAGPITKLFAGGEEESGGHVL